MELPGESNTTVSSNTEIYAFPLSDSQRALWYLHQFSPESAAYNIPVGTRLHGELDKAALQQAVNHVVSRHEILRTTYHNDNGHPSQHLHPSLNPPIGIVTLDSPPQLDQKASIDAILATTCGAPFDLTNAPPIKVTLVELNSQDHYLIINFHHIACDHTTVTRCLDEIAQTYDALTQGRTPSDPPPPLQYADYVIWSTEHQDQSALENKLTVWRNRLAEFSGLLELPLDTQRPPQPSFQGAQLAFAFDATVSSAVAEFSRENASSLYLTLLSGFSVLLSRYCHQTDIIVGTPFSNRNDDALEAVFGCFINTLPIALEITGNPSFFELLSQVTNVVMEARDNQDVPLENIVEALNPHRDASYNPLFQAGFVFQEPPAQLQLAGLRCDPLDLHSGGAMYDLHLWMWQEGGILRGYLWYNTDIFKQPFAHALVNHLETLCHSLVKAPENSVSRAMMLPPAEAEALQRWAWGPKSSPDHSTLHGWISASARTSADRTAIKFADQSLTYGQLEERSDRMAGYLQKSGLKHGEYAAIALPRSIDMLVTLIAVMKTGAAYLPTDPDFPADRLDYMLQQSSARLLITTSDHAKQFAEYSGERVFLDTEAKTIAQHPPISALSATDDSLLYLIFTSGSTGLPKGVQVSHRNVINFLNSMMIEPGCSADDVVLAVTTLSFDIAVLELFLPLVTGATVVIASRQQSADGHALENLIKQENISLMQATPSTWRLLLASTWTGSSRLKALCGGEAMAPDLAAQLHPLVAELWNMYGPTETTVWSTCYQIVDPTLPILIGKPIGNTGCYLLDDNFLQVAPNLSGELYIGGAGVAEGYINQPALTDERFIPNPFDKDTRLYRTGDLATFRPDGNLEYQRRVDNQVKVRGYRIELEEIETTLITSPAISAAAVIVRELNDLDRRLVAYVCFTQGAQLTATDMRKLLRIKLPDYMIPQQFVILEQIPLTANGKTDRKALPEPNEQSNPGDESHSLKTPTEHQLAEIWLGVLGNARIRANSVFFDIGGHSLLSLTVVQKIEQQFGVRIELRELMLNTLEQQAARIDQALQQTLAETNSPKTGLMGRLFKRDKQ